MKPKAPTPRNAREVNSLLLARRGLEKLKAGEPLTRAELAAVEQAEPRRRRPRPTVAPADPGAFGEHWPPLANSILEASNICNISRRTLAGHRDSGAKGFNADGTVDLHAYRTWLVGRGSKLLDNVPSMESARLRKVLAEAGMAELRLAQARGEMVPAAQVENDSRAQAERCKFVLQRQLLEELPPHLEGLDAPSIKTALKKVFYDICALLDTPEPEPPTVPAPVPTPPPTI